ncbi:hypothetical protein SAY86_008623 [Trapa natans]|uniref:Uncharacterized protein n=1 Tax=Trapa natans TaxID=22666 RepID=A0AAN7K8W6_TRANT|nr:hypothetical protein SAY86_008623 [Trapa natans]
MAKLSVSFFIVMVIAVLSADGIVRKTLGKTCEEGLLNVKYQCNNGKPSLPCEAACFEKHSNYVQTYCEDGSRFGIHLPVCMCVYPC